MPYPNVLRTSSGQLQAADSVDGPSSYPTGGFSVNTDLGRVNTAMVDSNNDSYEARATGVGSAGSGTQEGFVVVQLYSQDGTGEVDAGTDVSGTEVSYSAFRQ